MKLALPVVLMSVAFSMQAFAGPQCGDADGDGSLSLNDSTQIRRHVQGKTKLTPKEFSLADVNLDGKITDADSDLVKNAIARKVNCLPCPADRDACKPKPPPSDPGMPLPGRLKTDPSKGRLHGFL